MRYNPSKVEKKWQRYWVSKKFSETKDSAKGRGNFMLLTEFPYPSGNLHIGHWYTFAVSDILARFLRMKGHNVLYPIGFDAFGLPAENAAIKNNTSPNVWTKKNVTYMTKQLLSMGATFDWSRVVDTSKPDYYKWTQWMFLQFYKKGLAYRAKTNVNWCPKDKTVLANEQVVNGCCERCDTPVQQREVEQWMYKISEYTDRLIDDMEGLDWPNTTKTAQQNWIGRSRGVQIKFLLRGVPGQSDDKHYVEVFTTRPDTIFGATFIVISPETARFWLDIGWQASDAIKQYVKQSLSKRELERQEQKEKTGVDTGIRAVNPLSGEEIPVWVADYVLGSYGTGAIMAVPAHDERDAEFAKKFSLLVSDAALVPAEEVIKRLEAKKAGKSYTTYRLRDWILSRQRYWGTPIPMIRCSSCGYQPVSENDLPVILPSLKDFKPTDDGESPLAKAEKWVKTKCPKCKNVAERETDTMDTFVDSSWYFLRYADPKNKNKFADPSKVKKWLPVPMYVGGPEHNTMHLLYARFFTKVLYDLGYLEFNEPFLARRNHSVILGSDGNRMSKSRGNVVDPDIEVKKHGADVVRMYLAFMGPYSDQTMPWDSKGINGLERFVQRVWKMAEGHEKSTGLKLSPVILHGAIKKVGEDIKIMHYNTAISEMMKLLNHLEECEVDRSTLKTFTQLLAPMAPHLAEEVWSRFCSPSAITKSRIRDFEKTESGMIPKNYKSIHLESWPVYDFEALKKDFISIPVQINGKVRGTIDVPPDSSQDEVYAKALASSQIQRYVTKEKVKRVVFVPKKLLNLVV